MRNSKHPGKGPFDVSRKIRLSLVAANALRDAMRQLRTIDGVRSVAADPRDQLRVSYDASHLGIRDIEAMLAKAGIASASGAWWRLKSAWYRFLDENAHANAHSQGEACCNRPPSAHGGNGETGKPE